MNIMHILFIFWERFTIRSKSQYIYSIIYGNINNAAKN
jgi:hypothetical protein